MIKFAQVGKPGFSIQPAEPSPIRKIMGGVQSQIQPQAAAKPAGFRGLLNRFRPLGK
jgi:hypothetical protein